MGEAQHQELNIKAQHQELNITGQDCEEETTPQSRVSSNTINKSKPRGLKWWIQITLYVLFILLGQTSATLLGRLYYDKGGKSKWLAAVVQVIGFPILLPLYFILPRKETQTGQTPSDPPSRLMVASIYIFFGLSLAAMSILYSIGLQYLPVSTFSLICASQLAFNALFSLFLNSQKFTPYILNSLVLLTISSIILVFDTDSTLPQGVTKVKYAIGFSSTLASSALFGLLLSLTELAFSRILKTERFKTILDMNQSQTFVCCCALLVGLFASGEWKTLKTEMDQFELGKISYVMILVWTALTWQFYTIGLLGLVAKVSSLFSNVIGTVGYPIIPVFAAIFFHDRMNAMKAIAMVLAFWGFASYAYQQYLEKKKAEAGFCITINTIRASGIKNAPKS